MVAAPVCIFKFCGYGLYDNKTAPAGGRSGVEENNDNNNKNMDEEKDIQESGMRIGSPLFNHNGIFPNDYTCDGMEMSPPLVFMDVPGKAKSLALILRDPDAPSGNFYHWVVWNIDPKTKNIDVDSLPEGAIQGMATGNHNFYIGPCPPSGTHRYYFDLYALDVMLNLPEATTGPQLRAAIEGHIISTAQLMARYR